jgi:hypothetical protein
LYLIALIRACEGEKKEKEKRCGTRVEKTRGSKNNCMGAHMAF